MADMTPEQWRDKLSAKLNHEAAEVRRRRMWADGPHPWPTPPAALRLILGRLCELAETNLCALAVDAVAERLSVDGMRISNDRALDAELWRRIWQANNLDADSTIAHRDALITESSYLLVTPQDGTDPLVTVEDPAECVVAHAAGSRRKRVAALKRYHDEDRGVIVATVWTIDTVTTWCAPCKDEAQTGGKLRWELDPEFPGGVNTLGVVPMVEMSCEGEINHKTITTQKRINMTQFRLLQVADFQVVSQKYIVGAKLQKDASGNVVNPLKVGAEHAWVIESDDPSKVQIGQLDAADLGPLMAMLEADVTRFGAITKTPLYYVAGGLVNVSADAIRAAEAGLIKKISRRQLTFGEAWEETIGIALKAMDIEMPADAEIVWADAETRSLAERADASLKLNQAGYPFAAIARKMGESQPEIERLMAERAAEAAQLAPSGA